MLDFGLYYKSRVTSHESRSLTLFEKRSIGIAFEADGTVRVAELTSNMRTVTLSRVWTMEGGGADNVNSWKQAIDRLRDAKVDLENAVIGIPDDIFGQAIKAFIIKKSNSEITEKAIKNYCMKNSEPFMIPKYIEFRDSFSKSSSGKIDKNQLK